MSIRNAKCFSDVGNRPTETAQGEDGSNLKI